MGFRLVATLMTLNDLYRPHLYLLTLPPLYARSFKVTKMVQIDLSYSVVYDVVYQYLMIKKIKSKGSHGNDYVLKQNDHRSEAATKQHSLHQTI